MSTPARGRGARSSARAASGIRCHTGRSRAACSQSIMSSSMRWPSARVALQSSGSRPCGGESVIVRGDDTKPEASQAVLFRKTQSAIDPADTRQGAKVFCFFSSEKKALLTSPDPSDPGHPSQQIPELRLVLGRCGPAPLPASRPGLGRRQPGSLATPLPPLLPPAGRRLCMAHPVAALPGAGPRLPAGQLRHLPAHRPPPGARLAASRFGVVLPRGGAERPHRPRHLGGALEHHGFRAVPVPSRAAGPSLRRAARPCPRRVVRPVRGHDRRLPPQRRRGPARHRRALCRLGAAARARRLAPVGRLHDRRRRRPRWRARRRPASPISRYSA